MVQKLDLPVTLFGGAGFVGRYAAQALYRQGARIRIAERQPRKAYFLRSLGGVGQCQFIAADIRNKDAVRAAVAGSAAVVNLVGVLKGDFEGIHVEGAQNVAEAAAAAGVGALVHLSAIGADPESRSDYGRSKGEGEEAVRKAFPNATILRPSVLFGREDRFVNRFAQMARLLPALPVIGGKTRFQPAWVADVGQAVALAALDPRRFGGRTFELGGPQVISLRELNEAILAETGRHRTIVDVPDGLAELIAGLTGWLPGAPITLDQWTMLQRDNVVSAGAAGFEAFGIVPSPLAAITPSWLTAYRRNGRFAVTQPS